MKNHIFISKKAKKLNCIYTINVQNHVFKYEKIFNTL